MEIKLRSNEPIFKHRLKTGINFWCAAAITGLLGTWLAGTTIEHGGDGIMDEQLSVAITPLTGIVTLVWAGFVFWWYRERTARTKAYRLAAQAKQDILVLDDFGVTWGVADVTTTKIAWEAIGFYRIDRSKCLELGLPAGKIEVPIDELDGADTSQLESLLQSKGVRRLN